MQVSLSAAVLVVGVSAAAGEPADSGGSSATSCLQCVLPVSEAGHWFASSRTCLGTRRYEVFVQSSMIWSAFVSSMQYQQQPLPCIVYRKGVVVHTCCYNEVHSCFAGGFLQR